MTASVKYAVNDACLPVKLFHGHASYLADKADYIFIPRLKSVAKKEHICPKISGLPEMVKFSVPNLPKVIDTEVNLRKSARNLNKAFFEAGSFVTEDRSRIRKAARKALSSHKGYTAAMRKGALPLELLNNTKPQKSDDCDLCVALLGHSYNLYDEYANINILKKLSGHNAKVLTPESIEEHLIDSYSSKIGKRMFWTLGKRQLGALFQFLENRVDGIIYVMAFGCGIDSFIADLAERYAKRNKIPFYLMMLDEHSGEAGINTRVEAFVDMIRWKKKDEVNCPAFR